MIDFRHEKITPCNTNIIFIRNHFNNTYICVYQGLIDGEKVMVKWVDASSLLK